MRIIGQQSWTDTYTPGTFMQHINFKCEHTKKTVDKVVRIR